MDPSTILRGNAPAKIDDKGRLKIPNGFRSRIQQAYGRELFVTSLSGQYVRLYPMPVWLEMEEKLARMPTAHPARERFLDRVNYFGQVAEIDSQGRVLIQPRLRASALMTGEVDVMGHITYLDVWNHERFDRRLESQPFTEDDARALSEYGL